MILRLLETIGILYLIFSYVSCIYVLWSRRNSEEMQLGTRAERAFAMTVFVLLAPLVVADVIWERLTGGRGVI